MENKTTEEQCKTWVQELDKIQTDILRTLQEAAGEKIFEVTLAQPGDRVCVYDPPGFEAGGTVLYRKGELGGLWMIMLDDGMIAECGKYDFEVNYSAIELPSMWESP